MEERKYVGLCISQDMERHLFFESGIAYIETYLQGEDSRRTVSQSREFWGWWRIQVDALMIYFTDKMIDETYYSAILKPSNWGHFKRLLTERSFRHLVSKQKISKQKKHKKNGNRK